MQIRSRSLSAGLFPLLLGIAASAGDLPSLAPLQRRIALREYEVSQSRLGLQAPNRANGFRTYFGTSGVRVHERSAASAEPMLVIELLGFGREGALRLPGPGVLASEGARVEIQRPGLVEWYVNSPAGLELGFTLRERPQGRAALVIELELAGAQVRVRGDAVDVAAASGRRLEYSQLDAVDAAGRPLPAHFERVGASRLRLRVEDHGASYPIVVDPLLSGAADARLEADQSEARLGSSVASAGDVNGDGYADVIVGAYEYDAGQDREGAAFIFLGGPSGVANGSPTSAATQLQSDQVNGLLGWSVAGAGDVNGDGYADVIVGAVGYSGGQAAEGAAFVFLGSATGVADGAPATAAARLEANQANANFGYSVAGAGDVNGDGYADVIVAAVTYDGPQENEGAAFVFLGSAAGIADGDPITAATRLEGNQANAQLARSVAGAGDVNGDGYADVILGTAALPADLELAGSAFVFLGSASGIADGDPSSAATVLQAEEIRAFFGASVAGAGDVNGDGYADVIVGAYGWGELYDGAAFVFAGGPAGIASGGPTTAATHLLGIRAFGGDRFGGAVTGLGDVNGDGYADVGVAAHEHDVVQDEGAVFVFLGSEAGIPDGGAASAAMQVVGQQPGAQLGGGYFGAWHGTLAGAGDVNGDGYADLIAGAARYDGGQLDEGAAFVYFGGARGIQDGSPATAAAQLEANQANARLGASVAGAGDLNGDGYGDVAIGTPGFDGGEGNEGAVFVFLGSTAGIALPDLASATKLESNQSGASFGVSVAGAGDVNGDGYGDLIVGSADSAAFVFHGGAAGLPSGDPSQAATRLQSDQWWPRFGERVSGAGDVDGDGYADVIVSAVRHVGQAGEGAAFVFRGGPGGIPDGTPADAATKLEMSLGSSLQRQLSVASAGDIDGDGYADVIVGATDYSAGQSNEGGAFVFRGRAGGIPDGNPTNAATRIEANQVDAWLGSSVAGAGDVNGDGYADVIVGARNYDAGESDEGAAFLFLGGPLGIAHGNPATASAQFESNQVPGQLGTSVAGAGDVNGDGYADVIVGAPGYGDGCCSEGSAFVFLGSAAGIADGSPATADARLESNQSGAGLGGDLSLGGGEGVAGAGDVNGDGYADVIVGALGYDAGEADEGAAFLFLGNGHGRAVAARQLRSSSGLPVQPWGRVDEVARVGLVANHPEGHGMAKLEVELCPAGARFGHPLCGRRVGTSWTVLSSPTGVFLTQDTRTLTRNTLYRWRARLRLAPDTVGKPGIASSPHPAVGPWRTLEARGGAAGFRAAATAASIGCGIGPELALLLPVLWTMRQRRARHE